MIFSETLKDVSFTNALEKWLSLTNEQESPLDGTQKNWTQPVYIRTAQDLISRTDDKRSKVFNAHRGKFGSQWLNVVPCKNLGLKLDDQQPRISIGLRLGANICVAHTCHCGKRVERDGLHGLSCTKRAGRFPRHATLISLMKQTLGSLDLPSRLEQLGLYQTDGKRPDGVTMIPWGMGNSWIHFSARQWIHFSTGGLGSTGFFRGICPFCRTPFCRVPLCLKHETFCRNFFRQSGHRNSAKWARQLSTSAKTDF